MYKDMDDIEHSYLENPEKYASKLCKYKISCPNCGRKTIIPATEQKVLCKYCRKYIFRDGLDEFKYRITEAREKIKRKER